MRAYSVYHPGSRSHWRPPELVPKLVDLEQAGIIPHSLVDLSAGIYPRCAALFEQGFWLVQHFILELIGDTSWQPYLREYLSRRDRIFGTCGMHSLPA